MLDLFPLCLFHADALAVSPWRRGLAFCVGLGYLCGRNPKYGLIMKKFILSCLVAVMAAFGAGAQVLPGSITYGDGELHDASGAVIGEPAIVSYLGDSLYRATYVGAHRQYEVGMRLIKIGAPVLAGGLTMFVAGAVVEAATEVEGDGDGGFDPAVLMMACGILATAAGDACLSVGIPLASIGKGRLRWLADDYNSRNSTVGQRKVQPSLQLGACRHGYGLALNF